MRHGKSLGKLGRNPAHRRALLRNLATSLVIHGRIETTLARAKELRRVADRLVTVAKGGTLADRRRAMSFLLPIHRTATSRSDKLSAVHFLFEDLAPRYADRSGGYTRVLRTRRREGDRAQMALIEFVTEDLPLREKGRRRRAVKRMDAEGVGGEAKLEGGLSEGSSGDGLCASSGEES